MDRLDRLSNIKEEEDNIYIYILYYIYVQFFEKCHLIQSIDLMSSKLIFEYWIAFNEDDPYQKQFFLVLLKLIYTS